MEKIIIKTKHSMKENQSCWKEGLDTILSEIKCIEVDDPADAEHTIILHPAYKMYHDRIEIFIFSEYAKEIKECIMPYVDNYAMEIMTE